MGAQGTTTITFGAFPGASDASVAVTGQAGITGTSLVEAWIYPVATADHSVDEHMLEPFRVFAHSISAGTGFTISAFSTNQINEPVRQFDPLGRGFGSTQNTGRGRQDPSASTNNPDTSGNSGGTGPRLYGQYTIAWVWN
jgi:hypothetical protein